MYEYLSSFSCEKNKDVESFLHNKAIENEKRNFSRTSLVIDEENNHDIIGYFTVLVKNFDFTDVSATLRKRLTGNKRASSFVTILIGQLARSDAYKDKVSGKQILDLTIEHCKNHIKRSTALEVVCVEFEDIEPLHTFYESNQFKTLQRNENGLIISYTVI
ncbi:hypothetical protein [Bacillus sp. Au-Bac7]|uniref:hypothetical protein n=1 Tax=Bacillus sp. Au-Bac7 TaxID=2906458 RepID=UPI001E2CEA73|nr:hypothetical protein [Bacillus sp. Au-Bac7]MCE4051853.1 hypothetical protein [Bacillus sp. Au-Bac7]